MRKLEITKIKNAYGIKELRVNVNSDNKLYQNLIYSRNGTFKTSFSRCLYELSNGQEDNIKDRVTNIPGEVIVKIIEDNKIKTDLKNEFLIFSREIYEKNIKYFSDYSKELELLTIDKKKQAYIQDLIYGDLEEPKLELRVKAKELGLNLDKTLETLDIKYDGELDWYIKIFKYVGEAPDDDISKVNLKTIFQKPYDILENKNFKKSVNNYIDIYNKRIKEELFDENFDETDCLNFLESLKKTNFINETKKRGIILAGKSFYDLKDIQELIDKTIKNISNSPEILKSSQELVKSLGTSKEAKYLQQKIINDPTLIKQLSLGRKEIIRIALKKSGLQTKYWIDTLEKTMSNLKEIYEEIKDKSSEFENAIEIYRKRFQPVFDIEIKNKQESMLGLEMPSLCFKYKKANDMVIEEKDLYDILSSGEKTSLNIIKFIVEYISNKNNKPFIILDDIVETFDYSNRYAFIEYINDIVKDNVPIIILTHNFEFYRTLQSRVKELIPLVATATNNGTVEIQKNNNINRKIENVLKVQSEKELIFALPYLRETQIILQNDNDILNSCLHYKEKTLKLTIKDLMDEFPNKINLNIDKNKLYLDELKNVISIIRTIDSFDIVGKTIYAIGCRVLLEQKIIQKNFKLIEDIDEYQFAKIIDLYGEKLNVHVLELMEKVQLSTPEFIHCNAFMYEPLVDIDGSYLKKLYEEIEKLDINSIWK